MASRVSLQSEQNLASKDNEINRHRLPEILKSIHGPGVKYFYLSGSKRYDENFWDTKQNPDLHNWQYHRKKMLAQGFDVDAQISPSVIRQTEILQERAKRKKQFEVKELEQQNKLLAQFSDQHCMPDYDSYRLSEVVESRRTFQKNRSEQERQRQNRMLNEENKSFYSKMKKAGTTVPYDDVSFKVHLRRMYSLTKFPALHKHFLKGQASLPDLSLKNAGFGSNPETARSRAGNESLSKSLDATSKHSMVKKDIRKPLVQPVVLEKKKTLLSAVRHEPIGDQKPAEEPKSVENAKHEEIKPATGVLSPKPEVEAESSPAPEPEAAGEE